MVITDPALLEVLQTLTPAERAAIEDCARAVSVASSEAVERLRAAVMRKIKARAAPIVGWLEDDELERLAESSPLFWRLIHSRATAAGVGPVDAQPELAGCAALLWLDEQNMAQQEGTCDKRQ